MKTDNFTPYYAVIFTSELTKDHEGYSDMAKKMEDLAGEQDGFLGIETAREKLGISVSYWKDLKSIKKWRANLEHQEAQELGKSKWYKNYTIRISKIEREYTFDKKN